MVRSVEDILQKEFGKSLSDKGVHILDPFVGTGNFIMRVMREIKKTALPYKYEHELHCNEVMLLPYYIASMNIEHEYLEQTGSYKPFEGICLVDTFELAEEKHQQLSLFTAENTARVEKQRQSPIFVIIGNPPYNVGQLNENDNNKNRKYEVMGKIISKTYAKDSNATLLNKLSDPYIKAIRWTSDRLIKEGEGVVALVTNNSFVEQIAFDGMRKHLEQDFDAIYILDLNGNVRKNPKLSGTKHNVFGIQVGVSINIFVRKNTIKDSISAKIYYASVNEFWRKEEKYRYLEDSQHINNVNWLTIQPDQSHTWLTNNLGYDFKNFIFIASKEVKRAKRDYSETIFRMFSLGISTNRDHVVYNFNLFTLKKCVQIFISKYNNEVDRWKRTPNQSSIDNFIDYEKIKWSEHLKITLKRYEYANFYDEKIRNSIYRPFCKQYLYYDKVLNDRPALFSLIFPTLATEKENLVIWLKVGTEVPMFALTVNIMPNLLPQGGSQCFPFYTYDEDGTNCRENITDWALEEFCTHYQDDTITKWDIFYYTYAVLHHPVYRDRYAADLKRELPRIPYAPNFHAFAKAGLRAWQKFMLSMNNNLNIL